MATVTIQIESGGHNRLTRCRNCPNGVEGAVGGIELGSMLGVELKWMGRRMV